jgi:hypothetical protein
MGREKVRTILAIMAACLLLFPVFGEEETPHRYSLDIYDFETKKCIGGFTCTRWFSFIEPKDVDNEELLIRLTGGIGHEEGWAIGGVTNSLSLEVFMDRRNWKIYVKVEGESGTRGFFLLFLGGKIAAAASGAVVEVENGIIENYRVISWGPSMSWICVWYKHSTHWLVFSLKNRQDLLRPFIR